MAQRVAGLSLAGGLVVDPAARHRALEVDAAPLRDRRSEHDAAVPRVLRDKGEGVERRVVGVAVLDQLERRQAGGDPAGHGRARPGPIARWQVVAEPYRHLELHAQVVIGREINARWRGVNDLREDGAGGGLVDSGHLLHRPGRERDLPAGDLAASGLGHHPVQRVLDAIGVLEGRRPQRGVERTIARARRVGLERGAGGGLDRLGGQHQRVLPLCVSARLGRRGPRPATACSAHNRGGATRR